MYKNFTWLINWIFHDLQTWSNALIGYDVVPSAMLIISYIADK